MKECLWCKKEFQEKKPTAKYCSDSCRVMWNVKNKKKKDRVRDDVLINMISEMYKKLIAQIENAAFQPLVQPQNKILEIVPAIEKDNEYVTTEQKFASFELRLRKCKEYSQIKAIVDEIDKSGLSFFPKKNLKDLATELSKDFFQD